MLNVHATRHPAQDVGVCLDELAGSIESTVYGVRVGNAHPSDIDLHTGRRTSRLAAGFRILPRWVSETFEKQNRQ
jgi:hypothetical protein